MFYVYVVDQYKQSLTEHGLAHRIAQFSLNSKVETEEEAEAIAQELERLGYDCWIDGWSRPTYPVDVVDKEETGNHDPV